jgi:2-polyprenyl-3-methyl-5-hydroxy-6-metoxy-1,4-benzoquinol methylase
MQAIDHFESRARSYAAHADSRPEFAERFRLWAAAIDRLAPAPAAAAAAVDLGCGPGHLTQRLAQRGFRVIAIDGSEAMLARTGERLERAGVHDADLRHCALPLPDDVVDRLAGQADLITMSSVVEYVDADDELLGQCAKLLAPGGHLLASFPNRRALYWRLQRLMKQTPLFAGSASRHQRHQYDVETVQEMGHAAGLELRAVTFFALPLQRYTGWLVSGRRPRLATLFLADLQRTT